MTNNLKILKVMLEHKRNLFVALLILVFGMQLMLAQESGDKTWRGGSKEASVYPSLYVEAGGQLSMYHSSNSNLDPDLSSIFVPTGGIGVNLRFLKRNQFDPASFGWMGFQAGVHYAQSGFKANGVKVTGDYLCFPVDVQFYPTKYFYIGVGAEYCLNLKLSPSHAEIMGMEMSFEGKKSNDLKLVAGIGYMLNSVPLGVSVKYLMGTTEFMGNLPWKGDQIRASIFYRFGHNNEKKH